MHKVTCYAIVAGTQGAQGVDPHARPWEPRFIHGPSCYATGCGQPPGGEGYRPRLQYGGGALMAGSSMFLALSEMDRRQLALALDLLARRLRADGVQPTKTITAMRESLARDDRGRLEATNVQSSSDSVDAASVLFDLDEAADRVRLSRKTLERAIAAGELIATKFGRVVRVHPDDLDNFVRSHGRGRAAVAAELPGPTSTGAA